MNDRYARQKVLPEVGEHGQARLARATVAVVGAGGLGCPVLSTLAGAGVGRLWILDHDRVALSNLHRQPLYRVEHVGRPKAEVAAEVLRAHNPDVECVPRTTRVGPSNAPELATSADLVVDATDRLAVTYLLDEVCRVAATPLIAASALEQRGFVGGFHGGAPGYRAVFPDMPSRVGSCAENGVLGSAVAVVGGLQAHMALQVLLGLEPSPLGRLLSVDLATLTFGGFRFDDARAPSDPPVPFLARASLTAHDLVIDLRGHEEAPHAATPDAHRMTEAAVTAGSDLPRDRRLVFCCATGVRAHRAARAARRHGIEDVAVLLDDGPDPSGAGTCAHDPRGHPGAR